MLRVAVGDGEHRDLQNRGRISDAQTLGVGRRADSRRQRVAGIERHVRDRAALETVGRTRRPFGIGIFRGIAIVARVGIDDAADRAVLLRELRFQAAPADAVTCDHDLALDRNAKPLESLVIVLHAVIDIDEWRSDVAVTLVDDIGGQLVLHARGRLVARDRRFGQRRFERRCPDKLETFADRSRIQHLKGFDVCIPAP